MSKAGSVRIRFGKYKNHSIDEIAEDNAGLRYLNWLRGQGWLDDELVEAINDYLDNPAIARELDAALEMKTDGHDRGGDDDERKAGRFRLPQAGPGGRPVPTMQSIGDEPYGMDAGQVLRDHVNRVRIHPMPCPLQSRARRHHRPGGGDMSTYHPPLGGMEQYAMVKCPLCDGRKGGACHLNTTEGGRWQYMKCSFCDGLGAVQAYRAEKYREGELLREDRKRRLVTLRDEAKRLGITAKELSDREWGRA